MHIKMLRTLLAVALLIMLLGCKDDQPTPYKYNSSMRGDGSRLTGNDNSLRVPNSGNAFYISDDMIFYLGDSLIRHSLITGLQTNYSPSGMQISDKKYLGIDKTNQILYFAVNNAIYKVGFDRQNFSRISEDDGRAYKAPALSSCGQYLSAVSDNCISRLDLNTNLWTHVDVPGALLYAIYASDENAYYYYYRLSSSSYNNNQIRLCRIDLATQEWQLLMSFIDHDEVNTFNSNLVLEVSASRRYFAMQFVMEPWQDVGMFGGGPWYRCPNLLKVYDRVSKQVVDISSSFTYTFLPDTDVLLYSHLKYGMADIIRMDLSSGESTMIWDGFYENNYYSYSITRIYPRHDGGYMFINGWKRARKID